MEDVVTNEEESNNPVASLITNHQQQNEENIADEDGPIASISEVMECQFSKWYPTFSKIIYDDNDNERSNGEKKKRRKNVTIKSIILQDLPEGFRDYLLSDGIQLPLNATKLSSCVNDNDDDGWSTSDGEEENQPDDDEDEAPTVFHFPQLNDQLQASIDSLGGDVIPKLNWSAPKDAAWINNGSLKCQTPGDIYLLLKSSDFCLHDVLGKAIENCQDYDDKKEEKPVRLEIILRKWCNFFPSMEFRCFIRDNELIAISQRNHTQHYAHLVDDMTRIRNQVLDFFEDTIRHRFTLSNYVIDLYIDQKQKVWILDFNIWARSTDSLLFTWSELISLKEEDSDNDDNGEILFPYFRIVRTDNEVRQDPLSSYRAPIDTVDLASMTGGDKNQFEEFMKQCQKPSER